MKQVNNIHNLIPKYNTIMMDVVTTNNNTTKLASILGISSDDSTTASSKSSASLRDVKLYGHRGSFYEAPENTIQSFQRAIDHGAHGFELDVFLLKDGSVVVFHGDGDDTMPGGLKGYTGLDGSIVELTYDEARRLQFKGEAHVCPADKLEGASIPLLEEVLQHVKEHSPQSEVKIELKGSGTELPTVAIVEKLGMVDRVTFSSFYHDRIQRIREARPQLNEDGKHVYRTGALFANVPPNFIDMARKVDATEVHLRYDTCTKERVAAIHKAGFDSMSWFRGAPAVSIYSCMINLHDV